jgi:hypothetical protein
MAAIFDNIFLMPKKRKEKRGTQRARGAHHLLMRRERAHVKVLAEPNRSGGGFLFQRARKHHGRASERQQDRHREGGTEGDQAKSGDDDMTCLSSVEQTNE